MLIVVSGLPGTGKSTLADALGRQRKAAVLSVDPIESAIVRAGVTQAFESGLAAYLVVEAVADALLNARLDVVVDAVSSVEPARDMWRGLAHRHGVRMAVIVCSLADEALHARRLAGRERGLALAEPTAQDVEARRTEWTDWPEEHLALSSAVPIEQNVLQAASWLWGSAPTPAAPGAAGAPGTPRASSRSSGTCPGPSS
jgi:predicted kinase